MPTCKVSWCDNPVFATGLCRTHYKQKRKHGRILPRTPQPGDPSGYGVYGELTHDGDQRIMCHECGKYFRSVGGHIQQHGITAREYKRKHGLKQSTGLVSHAISKSYSEKSQATIGSDTWEKFVEARDPEAAQAARTDESFSHQRRKIGQSEQTSRQNIRGHHKPRQPRPCPICGRQIENQGWSTCGDKRCKAIKAFRQPTELAKAIDKHWEAGTTGDSEIARLVGCTPQNVRYRRKIRERAKTILADLEAELGPLP